MHLHGFIIIDRCCKFWIKSLLIFIDNKRKGSNHDKHVGDADAMWWFDEWTLTILNSDECQQFWAQKHHAHLDFAWNQEHKFGQALLKIKRNSSRNTAQIQPKLATVYTPIYEYICEIWP